MSMQAAIDILQRQPLFSDLDTSFLYFLAESASSRTLEKNEILFRHGDRARFFYLVRKGSISIEVAAIGGPPLEMHHLEPGELTGWSWLIPPYRWHFQARALEDSEVLSFDGGSILERCESDHDFGYELFKRFSSLMSERLTESRRQMMEEWNPPGFA